MPDHDLEVSPEEVDTADFQSAEDPAPFPEVSDSFFNFLPL